MSSSFAQPPASFGSAEPAWDLNIGQMARMLGGTLVLSSTPPVGGRLEPIGRVLQERRGREDYVVGDLVVMDAVTDKGRFLEEPMLRGASGILASRRITPWPGCYQILVPDVAAAVHTLARHRRQRFDGRVVVVITHAETRDPCWQWILSPTRVETIWIRITADRKHDVSWCGADEISTDNMASGNEWALRPCANNPTNATGRCRDQRSGRWLRDR
jgi:hypothetical protein